MRYSELQDIKERYDRMCKLVESDPSAGSHACAISYSFDIPVLIAEVERLNRQIKDRAS